MPFFTGSYSHTVDAKGRMNIPANYRKQLAGEGGDSSVYITANRMESFSFLCILPQDYFQSISKVVAEQTGGPFEPRTPEMKKLARMMSGAQECRYDDQGRLILPKKFLETACIKGQVTILGMHSYIQLWNPDTFRQYVGEPDPMDSGVAAE
jgi:MraZ protein